MTHLCLPPFIFLAFLEAFNPNIWKFSACFHFISSAPCDAELMLLMIDILGCLVLWLFWLMYRPLPVTYKSKCYQIRSWPHFSLFRIRSVPKLKISIAFWSHYETFQLYFIMVVILHI